MQFQVHYFAENERRTAEVEAGSPAEAVVKFRHTRVDGQDRRGRRPEVLSVLPVLTGDKLPW